MTQGQSLGGGPSSSYGRYQILAEVGRGTTAIVYKAHDPIIGRMVALKVLAEPEGLAGDQHEAFRARFRAEAELAGALHHPHIVTLYDVGEDYLVMEFLEGQPLSSLIGQGRALDPLTALRLGYELALALDFAHSRGIVHGALRPANVMLLPSGSLKVMDFGVARPRLRASGTAASQRAPDAYAAPERLAGQRADARSNIYSLGVVVHEMLAGRTPPGASTRPSSEAVNPTGASRLEGVLGKALATEPAERYASAGEFMAALEVANHEEHSLYALVAFSDPAATAGRHERLRDSPATASAQRAVGLARARDQRRLLIGTFAAAAALLATPSSWLARARWPGEPEKRVSTTAVSGARPAARTPIAAPRDRPGMARAPAPGSVGMLLVSSTPQGARAFIDGIEKGTTPFVTQHPVGRALVRAEKPGYHAASRLAWVFPGRSVGLSIPLQSAIAPGPVDVLSLPQGAVLAIDGDFVGHTNVLGLALAPGFHVVEIRRPGFQPWVEEVEVGPGTERVIATLARRTANSRETER